MNWEGAREEMRDQAENDVRATMLLDQIAEAENITVSNEEVEAEIDAYRNGLTTAERAGTCCLDKEWRRT